MSTQQRNKVFSPGLTPEQVDAVRLRYFDIANDAAYVFDFEDGRILDANAFTIGLLGYAREELLEMTVFDIHPDEERERMLELVETFRRGGQIRGVSDMHLKAKDGRLIPVEKNGSSFDLNGRTVVQCTCRDITNRIAIEAELTKRVEDMRILNSIALEITSGLELETILQKITESAAALLNADAGAIGLYDERKGALVYRYLHNLPAHLAKLEIPRGTGLTSFVLETKQAASIPDYLSYPGAIKEFKDVGIRAVAIAPLLVEGRTLGTLLAMHTDPRKLLDEYDLGMLEAVARQAAIAIYNAQLFERTRDEGEFRQALSNLTSLIGSSLDLGKVYDLICAESTKLFRSSGTYLYAVDTDKNMLVGRAAYGVAADEFLKVAIPLGEPSIASYIYHTRKPLLVDDVERHMLVDSRVNRKFKSKTLMGTPITVDGEVKSILVFANNKEPYFFSETQLERAKILGDQVAFAIKNAALYENTRTALEHERYVAITLQRSLLPDEIPTVPGTEFGAYYAPTKTEGALVGGDFYDLVQLADGRILFFIGDVSGKGIDAAAVTAMAKYALRSFAHKDPTPSYVLTQANSVVAAQLKDGSFVSLCYGLYDPETGKLILTNAGHPYPIHCSPARRTCTLIETHNPVVGLMPDFGYSQVETVVKEGDTVVLYTDGLIEARDDGDMFGMERLREAVAENRHLSAQDLAAHLAYECEAFARGNLADDMAVIILRRPSHDYR